LKELEQQQEITYTHNSMHTGTLSNETKIASKWD